MGKTISELRSRITELKKELGILGEPKKEIPELIDNTNLLRSNEYLKKSDHVKSELINTYEQYVKELENLLSTVFEIQLDLKDLLKEQTSLISESTKEEKRKKKGSAPNGALPSSGLPALMTRQAVGPLVE